MAPFSRFQVSPYKNALPSPTPPAAHYFPSTPSHSAAVASSDDWLYVGSGAEVVVLGWDEHGKGERERKSWHAGVGEVVSLAVQQGAWLAVSGKTAVRPCLSLPRTPCVRGSSSVCTLADEPPRSCVRPSDRRLCPPAVSL